MMQIIIRSTGDLAYKWTVSAPDFERQVMVNTYIKTLKAALEFAWHKRKQLTYNKTVRLLIGDDEFLLDTDGDMMQIMLQYGYDEEYN
jgi:hypothetical protein